jgi:hypothetical protein
MDDPHRAPAGSDRDQVSARIRAAADSGLISPQDRDIRLANVKSAQSIAELELTVRDLDQVQAERQAQPVSAVAEEPDSTTFTSVQEALSEVGPVVVKGVRRVVVTFIVVVTFAVLGALVLAFVAYQAGDSGSDDPSLFEPVPITSPEPEIGVDPTDDPGDDPSEEPDKSPAYALTVKGVQGFLEEYRKRFGSLRTAGITFYDDYVVMDVPVPGRNRHQGWLYRRDSGFTDFGGISANFPGTTIVDLGDLDVGAMIRNLARAKRTLGVEDISTSYVIVRQFPSDTNGPAANIYVSNEFHESGYLATTIAGRALRSYPYEG